MAAPAEPVHDVPSSGTGGPLRIGVSACLLGQEVRYDAGHKREPFVAEVLARHVELVPVCPEVAIGLGVPREPIRLEGTAAAPRASGVLSRDLDVTERLRGYGRQTAERLADISGYILKSKSPSCGLRRVKLVGEDGRLRRSATGIFAAELERALPLLPMVEEDDLGEPAMRENFMERVYGYRRWQDLRQQGLTYERLARFHAAHELILLSRSRAALLRLRRLLASAGDRPIDALAQEYGKAFMQALARPASRRGHAAALERLLRGLRRQLEAEDRVELEELIAAYRSGRLPRIVPLTLLRHHLRRHRSAELDRQLYLAWPQIVLGQWCAP